MSCGLLWLVFALFMGAWLHGNRDLLLDTMLQTDDARTWLFPFHRYTPGAALKDDVIANDFLALTPPSIRLLYAIFVPLTGLYAASKFVQALCFLVMLYSGVLIARSHRAGLAPALLLVFFLFHTPYVTDRVAGGLARSFAFPALFLWMAGTVTGSARVRFASALVAAATYPTALALILATEGIFALRPVSEWTSNLLRGRLKRYVLLVVACVAISSPYLISTRAMGRMHTLAEAKVNPAFGPDGRIKLFPMIDPVPAFGATFTSIYDSYGSSPLPPIAQLYQSWQPNGAWVFIALLVILAATRLSPMPFGAVSMLAGAVIVYILARVFAFRLYDPLYFCTYGMQAASILLAVSVLGLMWANLRDRSRRATLRNFTAAAFITLLWVLAGNGVVERLGMNLDRRSHLSLYAFVETLPTDVRIAGHPLDGEGIAYWAGRATLDNFETLQPWIVQRWRIYEARTRQTLTALYATRQADVLSYCDKYQVTHLLLNRSRYGRRFLDRAMVFEPFDSFLRELLINIEFKDLVLRPIPESAVVFRKRPLMIVDVARLREAWGKDGAAAPRRPPDRMADGLPAVHRETGSQGRSVPRAHTPGPG